MERRDLLKGLAAGIAGVRLKPDATAVTEVPLKPDDTQGVRLKPDTTTFPQLLDEHQRRTLASLAEMLVPGSVAAGVVDLIDRVAAVDGSARQRQLLNALGRFDVEARSGGASRWVDLNDAARLQILRRVATASPPAAYFLSLRTAVANAYLATEPGMKEFGWTGRTAWKELPGCTHPNAEHD